MTPRPPDNGVTREPSRLTVRVTAEERAALQQAADRDATTVSEFIRRAPDFAMWVVTAVQTVGKRRKVSRFVTMARDRGEAIANTSGTHFDELAGASFGAEPLEHGALRLSVVTE